MSDLKFSLISLRGRPRGVMVKVMDCRIVVRSNFIEIPSNLCSFLITLFFPAFSSQMTLRFPSSLKMSLNYS